MSRRKNRFSGHQTFAFRYGWLEKGYRFLSENKWFTDEDAIVELGVGKNMVDSIKYWCEMTDIVADGKLTDFAHNLLSNDGWDPFLENDASLWLLHWKLCTNREFLSAGGTMFSYLHKPEFSKREVAELLVRIIEQGSKKPPSDSVLLRDIDCYIRVYAGSRRFEKKKAVEESFDCPLQELGLIYHMSDAEMYRFAIGPKSSLPPEIIGYAVCDYFSHGKRDSARVQEVLYHEFSPGQVFMLDENSLVEAINILNNDPNWGKYFKFTESAGIARVECSLDDGNELLKFFYMREKGE